MAEGAARPAAMPSIGLAGRWIGVGVVLVLLLILGLLFGAAAILLVGCVVAGFGITYLSSLALSFEERFAFGTVLDRKSTRLNSSHGSISYAVFCLKKQNFQRVDRRF